ncbi:hypothetical protein BJI67_16305 (plasmid) [Acidihalobacter aeolianus]|uniref:Uncharacterized protein n=1 Tax=Acidihalobacter aeolianus TaxID=2792603 RepID=A0A1D8KCW9_9GAMM|nr:hypothetical protein [Acidihalobacter aeolianus]AOV18800.1 hypothetical protein BJI67_16305 [Acidihalobacter aeolianus]
MPRHYRQAQLGHTQSSMLVAGALNVVWLAGFLRNPSRTEDGKTTFLIQQTNNPDKAIPVQLPSNKRLRNSFRDKGPVKVVGHIMGTQKGSQRSAYVRVISVERPTQLEMPPSIAWMDHLRTEGTDTFKPFVDGQRLSQSSNSVKIAGFVGSIVKQPVKANGNGQTGTARAKYLWLLIKQVEDDGAAIPVRVSRYTDVYASRLQIGQPVMIEGNIKIDQHSGVFIDAPHVLQAEPGDIPYPPEWAKKMLLDFIDLTRRSTERVAKAQATQPETSNTDPAPNIDRDAAHAHGEGAPARRLASASDL